MKGPHSQPPIDFRNGISFYMCYWEKIGSNGGKFLGYEKPKICQNYYERALLLWELGITNLTLSKCTFASTWYSTGSTKWFEGAETKRNTRLGEEFYHPISGLVPIVSFPIPMNNLQLENIMSLFVASIFSFNAWIAAHLPWPGNGPDQGCPFHKFIVRKKEKS